MRKLETLLAEKEERNSGIYWINLEAEPKIVSQIAERHNFQFMHLDGKNIKTGRDFLIHIGKAIECPYMAGDNWNEVLDCMRDFGWFSENINGYLILYNDAQIFALNDAKFFAISMDTLQDVINFWNEERKHTPMFILFMGGTNVALAPEILV